VTATRFDLSAYCKRIGYERRVEPDLETLRGLHEAHVRRIPFENLEIQLGRPMSLDDRELHRLIIGERRGGYCFQMNLLFAKALEVAGFPVTLLQARVWLVSAGAVPAADHLTLQVQIGSEPWLVDAGFGGGGLRRPIPLRVGEESLQGGWRCRLRGAGRYGTMLERLEGEKWVGLYSFDTRPSLPVDFAHANYFLSTSPESFFVQNRVCAIATEEGETTLLNDTLRIRRGDEMREERVEEGPAYLAALREHFGIDLPSGTVLKPLRSQ
jgi:N-hydroxyarylamine O-acetyltransferase